MAPSRSGKHERATAQQLVHRMADAWMRADVEAIVELFAPQGVFISPGGIARGQHEIAAAAQSFLGGVERVSVEVRRVMVDGSRGMAEWAWQETSRGGEPRTMEDAIVFELSDGKLIYWREYFDPAQTRALEP